MLGGKKDIVLITYFRDWRAPGERCAGFSSSPTQMRTPSFHRAHSAFCKDLQKSADLRNHPALVRLENSEGLERYLMLRSPWKGTSLKGCMKSSVVLQVNVGYGIYMTGIHEN